MSSVFETIGINQEDHCGLRRSAGICDLFEAQVVSTPDAVAVVFNDQEITYGQLNARANQVAHYLRSNNTGIGGRVAVCLHRSLETAVSILGVLKAGAVYVPMFSDHPKNRRDHILNDSRAQYVLTQQSLAHHFDGFAGGMLLVDRDRRTLEAQDERNLDLDIEPEFAAYIFYTSGSTGRPKGVLGHHKGAENYFSYLRDIYRLGGSDVVLQLAPFTFDASLRDLLAPLTAGAKVVLVNQDEYVDPHAALAKIKEQQVTCLLSLVPSRLSSLVEAASVDDAPYGSIRLILVSGEALYGSLCHKARAVFGKHALVVNQYGPTECTMTSTYFPIKGRPPQQGAVCLGEPIYDCRVHVLDADLRSVSKGTIAEAFISSPGLAWGYLNLPGLTAERFLPNPFAEEPGSRFYRTGDLVRLGSERHLHFCGRVDRQVKLNGIRIELGEIESVLLRFDAVRSCAVTVRSVRRHLVAHERLAEADATPDHQQRLVAYFVSQRGLSSSELRRFLRAHLPENMIPQEFVRVQAIPLNSNGKIDVGALPEPEHIRPQLDEPYIEPASQVDSSIAAVWREVLALDRVGVNDDFFDLGGDSLKAVQVVNRLRRSLELNVSVREMLEAGTVAKLNHAIQQSATNGNAWIPPPKKTVERADGYYPLSFAEQGIWFLWKLDPDNPYYIARGIIELRGELDLPVFQRAWRALIQRHEILRVRFGVEDGCPRQRFMKYGQEDIPVINLQHLSAEECAAALRHQAEKEIERPFDLEKDPLLRTRMYRLSSGDHALLLVMHEIIIDVWSKRILLRDLGALYQGFLEGRHNPLPALEVNYGDFALWEQEHLTHANLEPQEEYWRGELAGELPVLSLPFDHPRPNTPSRRGESRSMLLDPVLTKKVKALCKQGEVTLFTALLAAYSVLLRAYTGQEDLIIGAPFANRNNEAAEHIAGFHLNMLPLRIDLSADPSFESLLADIKSKVTGAIANAHYPFIKMLDLARAPRDSRVSPMFQTMFNMLNYNDFQFHSAGIDMGYRWFATPAPKYDLALYAQEHQDRIYLQFSYSSELFDDSTIDRMLRSFIFLLRGITDDPKRQLSRLEVMSGEEKRKLLLDFNRTDRDYRNGDCVHQLFERQVAKTPDRTALVCEDHHLSYAELNVRANQLAHRLRRLGIGPERIVAVCTDRSLEMVTALLGTMKAGGAYVALDPNHPLPRLLQIIEETRPAVILLQKHLDRFAGFIGEKLFLDSEWPQIATEDRCNPVCMTAPDNLLNIVCTSGSTGRPRSAMITIRSVLNRLFWMWEAYPFQPGDVAVMQKSYALVAAAWECFGGLLSGVPTVILSYRDVLDPERLWDTVVDHNVSYLLASPALFGGILAQGEQHPGQWSTLRLATTGAESISPDMVLKWRKVFPKVPLLNLYGSTECSSNVTEYDTNRLREDAIRVPIGVPLANTRVYILGKKQQPTPAGVPAELFVAGDCLARGYLNLPGLTAERFLPDPYSPEAGTRVFATGDLARFRKNVGLELIGRKDHQVKVRGFRVELSDVETSLSRHPKIKDCVVVFNDANRDIAPLIAYMVADEPVSDAALRQFMRELVPDYMVPSAFVQLQDFPLTPNGKVDRHKLPTPMPASFSPHRASKAPRNRLQLQLVQIWQEILHTHPIGVSDNFFDLGGNSLLAVRAMARIESELGERLPLSVLFQAATIEDLSAMLGRGRSKLPVTPLVKIKPYGDRPPFFCVHGAGGHVLRYLDLARHLDAEQPFYGLQCAEVQPDSARYTDIEAMAAEYIAAIKTVQKEGPFLLGGWSMGGLVAYEMARQLKERGETTAALVLMDTKLWAPDLRPAGIPQNGPGQKHRDRFTRRECVVALDRLLMHESATLWSSESRQSPLLTGTVSGASADDRLLEFGSEEMRKLILKTAGAAGLCLDEADLDNVYDYLLVYMTNVRAMDCYVPHSYGGSITLLQAANGSGRAGEAAPMNRRRVVEDVVQIHRVPGDHYSMLVEPHVRDLAKRLSSVLCAS